MPLTAKRFMPGPERRAELLRFATTGGLCASFNVVVATLLNARLGVHYLWSLAICFALVTVVGFVLNRWWTFRKHGPGAALDLARYVSVAALHMVAGLYLCRYLVDTRELPYPLSIAVVAASLAPLTYLAHRCWSFGLTLLATARRRGSTAAPAGISPVPRAG